MAESQNEYDGEPWYHVQRSNLTVIRHVQYSVAYAIPCLYPTRKREFYSSGVINLKLQQWLKLDRKAQCQSSLPLSERLEKFVRHASWEGQIGSRQATYHLETSLLGSALCSASSFGKGMVKILTILTNQCLRCPEVSAISLLTAWRTRGRCLLPKAVTLALDRYPQKKEI
jgi:hypothetical protein